MKFVQTAFSVLVFAGLLSFSQAAGDGNVYKHVALIGVDGAGAFFKQADTPNIDEIFKDGAVTYEAITSDPSISAQCWGSMLLGVTPDFHRLSNSIIASRPYKVDSKYPSVFRVVRENDPDAVLASFCNWNPINVGIIENNLGVHEGTGDDPLVAQMTADFVLTNKPTLLFVQFDSVDGAGHGNGYGTELHLRQITTVDKLVGQIFKAYEDAGILDDTLFIVTADHGGTPNRSHGGTTEAEMKIMVAARGKTVQHGTIGEMGVRDLASIVLHAFGYKQPPKWTSRVPSGLFVGVVAGERPDVKFEWDTDRYLYGGKPAYEKGKTIAETIGTERVSAYFPFDGATADYTGKTEPKENGKLYYSTGFAGQACSFDDGYLNLAPFVLDPGSKDVSFGDKSFSVCFWIKSAGITSDPCILSNKDWLNGARPGFVLSINDAKQIKFNLGTGEARTDHPFGLPLDFEAGWTYVAMVLDRDKGTCGLSYDFEPIVEQPIQNDLGKASADGLENLCIGQDGTTKYNASLSATLDEFMIVNGVLTNDDIAKMKTFYFPPKK